MRECLRPAGMTRRKICVDAFYSCLNENKRWIRTDRLKIGKEKQDSMEYGWIKLQEKGENRERERERNGGRIKQNTKNSYHSCLNWVGVHIIEGSCFSFCGRGILCVIPSLFIYKEHEIWIVITFWWAQHFLLLLLMVFFDYISRCLC